MKTLWLKAETIVDAIKNTLTVDESDLEKIIEKIVENNQEIIKNQKEIAVWPLMGIAMKELRGKAFRWNGKQASCKKHQEKTRKYLTKIHAGAEFRLYMLVVGNKRSVKRTCISKMIMVVWFLKTRHLLAKAIDEK